MGAFGLGKMTLKSLFGKPETVQYPFETKTPPAGLKGHVEINIGACILCGICQKRCPADAIVVTKSERKWEIDQYRCVQCGSCIRECPRSCLTMDPHYAAVATQKTIHCEVVPEREKETKAGDAAKYLREEYAENR